MEKFTNQQGVVIIDAVIKVIQENTANLSQIDGAIGDGDHGVNMNKAVSQAKNQLSEMSDVDLSASLKVLSDVMLNDIGGSMGPLYGSFFRQMFRSVRGKDTIDAKLFNEMLQRGMESIKDIGNAKVGDKTMLDTLEPAVIAFSAEREKGSDFTHALEAMKYAAEKGKVSTIDLVAKVGRSSRLGDRSRGFLDAGATSCCLILTAMADALISLSK